ncbi:hypothetical protein RQP46_006405 [Phenoliferia psychrophenolica]
MAVELLEDAPATSSEHAATVAATFDSYLMRALRCDEKLLINSKFVAQMVQSNPFPPEDADAALSAPAPKDGDHERLRSTLRQCVRDWSDLGKVEREETYGPVLRALDAFFGDVEEDKKAKLRVLVPGAGLGRLLLPRFAILSTFAAHADPFGSPANEFSLFMLIASAFILNNMSEVNEFEIYPYLHSFSNIRSRKDLLTPVLLPDVLPSVIASSSKGDFSFAAGAFEEVYGNDSESWDCVVTCFFIDTARNVVQYLERIYALLKPGAPWINVGPTLWHHENIVGERSLELTLEDVKTLAQRIGFVFLEESEISTSYTSNPRSTLQHRYTASFWVATKG